MSIPTQDITGLILAGGRGSRMGGVDKGLQLHRGKPLFEHALERLRPQVGAVLINANRNLDAYAAYGLPVVPDASGDFAGPLAGFLAGLVQARTDYMVTVPCDSPAFPLDFVARLADALTGEGADVALARTQEAGGRLQTHPVFCLMKTSLQGCLQRYMADGGRKIEDWLSHHRKAVVDFSDAAAFFNANTLDDLRQIEG